MKLIQLSLVLFLFFYSCKSQKCNDIAVDFSNYSEAEAIINKTNFSFTDKLNTENSSWVRGAYFYSCDSKYGFFLIETDVKTYIHQNVPIEIWNDLKKASSIGSFYNRNIKHKYQLNLK